MKRSIVFFIFLWITVLAFPQTSIRRVLFLGNSYTYVNDLPSLVAQLAHSAGDSLYHDQNTPGGYTLGWNPIAHATDPNSLAKIALGGWDFVVIQEQSQTPAIPALRDSCMYPASFILHDSVKSANPCARVLFYLTWGRRYGGQQCFTPNYCSTNFADFDQMQDSLTTGYKGIADSLSDWIAPAGEAWRLYLLLYPHDVLHMSDDSHPNQKGSYLAACVFYDVIFGKRSYGLSFLGGLSDTAYQFQKVADTIVFGNPSLWNLWNDEPSAAFKTTISGDTLYTENQSVNTTEWHWNFGDGNTSDEFEPVHIYNSPGNYTVTLAACDNCRCDTTMHQVEVVSTGMSPGSNPSESIILSTPDASGNIILTGYSFNGLLRFYDITGRLAGTVPVTAGRANISRIPHGFFAWHLEDRNRILIARGKLLW